MSAENTEILSASEAVELLKGLARQVYVYQAALENIIIPTVAARPPTELVNSDFLSTIPVSEFKRHNIDNARGVVIGANEYAIRSNTLNDEEVNRLTAKVKSWLGYQITAGVQGR